MLKPVLIDPEKDLGLSPELTLYPNTPDATPGYDLATLRDALKKAGYGPVSDPDMLAIALSGDTARDVYVPGTIFFDDGVSSPKVVCIHAGEIYVDDDVARYGGYSASGLWLVVKIDS